MGIKRAAAIQFMRKAFRTGQSVSDFRQDMREKGLSYRWTDMLSDWRTVNQLEAKAGRMRFVRKDRYPTKADMVDMPWEKMSAEYMYKVKVRSRLRPDEPVTERFVNLMSDVPMTRGMIEQGVIEKWAEWEDYTAEAIEEITPWTAVHKTV